MWGLSRRGFRGKDLTRPDVPYRESTKAKRCEIRATLQENAPLQEWFVTVENLRPDIYERALWYTDRFLRTHGVDNQLERIVPRFPYLTEREKKRIETYGWVSKRIGGPVRLVFVDVEGEESPLPYYKDASWFSRFGYRLARVGTGGEAVIPVVGGMMRYPVITAKETVKMISTNFNQYLNWVRAIVHETMHYFNIPNLYRDLLLYETFTEVSSELALESLGFPTWLREEPPINPYLVLSALVAEREGVDVDNVIIERADLEVRQPVTYTVLGERKELSWGEVRQLLVRGYSHPSFLLRPRETRKYWEYWISVIDRLRVCGLNDVEIAERISSIAKKGGLIWDSRRNVVSAVESLIQQKMKKAGIRENELKRRIAVPEQSFTDRLKAFQELIMEGLYNFALSVGPGDLKKGSALVVGENSQGFVTTWGHFRSQFGIGNKELFPSSALVEFEGVQGGPGGLEFLRF